MASFTPRRPVTQQSRIPTSEDELDAPELIPVARSTKPITRWQRR